MNYWHKQTQDKPLFPDIEWNRPERLDLAGKLGIIGGNSLSFAAVADSYRVAKDTGAGEVRVLLPDGLRRTVPTSMTDVIFSSTTQSGGLSTDAKTDINSLSQWSDVLLLCGDCGKNSQTAILYENLVVNHDKPTVITRDAVDLLQNSYNAILDNPNIVFVLSFSQLQRLFRAVYYPKVLTFNMQLNQFIETVHKFTISFPVTLVTLHADQLVIAKDGEVVTQPWSDPMRIWRGHTAAKAASYLLWTPSKPLEAIGSSIV